MSVKRRVNLISQQRVDIPDLRSVESAVSNDFDDLFKSFITGTDQGYVLRGFELSMSGAIGGAASGLQLVVDPGAVLHINSSQSGTFLLIPPGTPTQQLNSATNSIVDGAFAPSAINYISIEYERFIDNTTSSQVYIWNPTTKTETVKNAPRAQILRFRIKITTSTPPSNYLPIATVTTDAGNNVTRIDDARSLFFSQGTGGFNPDPFNKFSFSEGREPNSSFSTSNSINPFQGGDKVIGTVKEKLDAITTQIQDILGTPYWTSQNNSGSLASMRADLGNTLITGRGSISHSEDVSGQINWDQDIFIRVVGSKLAYKLVANPSSTDITLADDEVAYLNLVRNVPISPNLIWTNGSKTVTSVGAVSWTSLLQSGDWIKVGSSDDSKFYEIDTVDSLTQVTLIDNYAETSTGVSGIKSKYSFGSYQAALTPSSNRDIQIASRGSVPINENVFWLYLRSDNSGVTARVYIRFLGSELEQGKTEEISDNVPLQLLEYIGAPLETSSKPKYVSALTPGSIPQIVDITFGSAAQIGQNEYFTIDSSADLRQYYFWFNIDSLGSDPLAPDKIGVEVDISTGMTNVQVANAVVQAFDALTFPDFHAAQKSNPNQNTVRVTWSSAGTTAGASNFNLPSPFAISVIQTGTGTGNAIVIDDENLTLSIKRLDMALTAMLEGITAPGYDEPMDIVAPISSGANITLPLNTRLANIQQKYNVGKATLEVFLNGQYLRLGTDWDEVGVSGHQSDEIEILQDLVVGDVLEFRMSAGGGSAGGGGIGPQGPQGPPGASGTDAVGGPVTIATYIADYTVVIGNNILKGDCSVNSQDIVFTLPPASTATGRIFFFKKIDASAFQVKVQAYGSELIDGLNMQALTIQFEGFMVVCDGTTWSLF